MFQTILWYLKLALTLICQGHLFRTHYQIWMIISWFRKITSVYMAPKSYSYSHSRLCNKIILTLSFEGQDDPEWSELYQKSIQRTQISWIRCIAHVYTLNSKTHNGCRRPYLIWPWRHSWRGGKQAPRWFVMFREGPTNLIQVRNAANTFLQTGL